MPEGHAIHRLAAQFTQVMSGEVIAASSPQGRFTEGAAVLDSQRLVDVQAYGKHMFLGFAPRQTVAPHQTDPAATVADCAPPLTWLHIHLGIYGSWRFYGDSQFIAQHAGSALNFAENAEPNAEIVEIPVHTHHDDSAFAPHEHFADRWFWTPAPFTAPQPYGTVRLRLVSAHGVADLSGPNTCELLDEEGVAAVLARLGPDPLRPDSDFSEFVKRCATRQKGIGEALMDQSVIAGVGNIYRAEVLYAARLNPFTPAREVTSRKLRRIWNWLEEYLPLGVESGRITTADPDDYATFVERELAAGREPQAIDSRYYVYQRQDRPCLCCNATIKLRVVGGRKLYWCPRCQR